MSSRPTQDAEPGGAAPRTSSAPQGSTGAATDLRGIVGAYDVRGVAGESLTEGVARALGAAFADLLASRDVHELIVTHDMRVSSPSLAAAFADGACRRGAVVAAAGLAATDQLYCASGLHRAAGAMITASHNPPRDNGIKLCLPGAAPISRDTGLAEIQEGAERYLAAGDVPRTGQGRIEPMDTLEDYLSTVLELAPVRIPAGRTLRVVVDAANAMAGLTVPALADRVPGLEIIPLYFELDGTFPHHEANPLDARNLVDLQAAVREHGADLGLAFDGDADRCVAVDETGAVIPPSALTALIAVREIARARAAGEEEPVVVANLVSSRHVGEAIEEAGGRRVRSKVGHSLIKALMAEQNAVFGGEHSAHYYFRDFHFADSGMLAALHLLGALLESGGTASQLVAEHDPYAASGEINSRVADAQAAREAVRAHVSTLPGTGIDDLDGLTVDHWDVLPAAPDAAQNWWASIRSSNTEPLLRLNVEAQERATMERVRDELLAVIRGERTEDASDRTGHPEAHRGAPDAAQPAPEGAEPAAEGVETAPDAAERAVEGAEPVAEGASGADVPAWVREKLRCPRCRAGLRDVAAALRCSACGEVYPVTDGIAMLVPPA